MIHDLLTVADLEPPMGDLFLGRRLDAGRSVWTAPALPHEAGQPDARIIHQRVLRLHGMARLDRIGLRRGQGYHKCGSGQYDLDWITGLRVLAHEKERWKTVIEKHGLRAPAYGTVAWLPFPKKCETDALIIEVRTCGIDAGWTPWNLAMSALVLEGKMLSGIAPRNERTLELAKLDLGGLPRGVSVVHRDGEVRYRTKKFEIGFTLSRPGLSYFCLHTEDAANAGVNLLNAKPPLFSQGTQLHPVGAAPLMASALRCDIRGSVSVKGNTVTYDFATGGQKYRLAWSVAPDEIALDATRSAAEAVHAWQSSAWTIGLRNSATPSHVLGHLLKDGETGAVALPALLVLPKYGALQISASSGSAWLRSDCFRSQDLNVLEIKLGETRTPEGTYDLPAGEHRATITLRPAMPPALLKKFAPAVAHRALRRTQFAALTFRTDTGTLSNNGASMHCPICLDTWSSVALALGADKPLLPGLPAPGDFLRHTLERWLAEGPGYASGRLRKNGRVHHAADEYLMTGTAALRGLGDYLASCATPGWFQKYRANIRSRLDKARRRDLDGDGLIESAHRTGTSGGGQWSTCWYDVISFGWKDAFANAILYGALRKIAEGLRRFGESDDAAALDAWADKLHASYRPAFWNGKNGWFGGWRCREGKLHDYAFLPVNGVAVVEGLLPRDEARAMLRRLLDEARRVKMPDAALGLPGNLHPIADADLADIMHGYPFGYYQNGGRTHSQTRHFVMALYECGLTHEADALLERLCAGLAEARVFGGNQSGVDWRYWDDRPCGYEGLLTDQFGLIEAIMRRWGK